MSDPIRFSAKRNFLFNAASTAVNLLYPLFSFAYVSHIMGPVIVGRINLATSLASWFALLASVAIPIYGAREIARARDDRERLDKTFSELVIINLVSTAFACSLYLACLFLPGKMRAEWPLFAVTGLFIAANCISLDWFFQGIEHFPSTFVRNLCVKSASMLLIVLVIDGKEDYILFAAIGAGGAACYNLWGIREALRRVRFRIRGLDPRAHLKPLGVLAGATILSSAYMYLDGVLLGLKAGEHALGLYSTAVRITRTSHVVIIALTTALIPRLSRYLESGMADAHAALSQKSIHAVYFICFPLFAMLWALAPALVGLLAGPEFAEAGLTLRLVLPLLPLAGFTNFLGLQIFFPNGLEKPLLVSAIAGAAVNLGLNLLLIPALAENGSAIATVAAEGAVMLVLLAYARNMSFPFRLMDATGLRYLGLGALAGAVCWWVSGSLPQVSPVLAVALSLGAGSAFYLGVFAFARDPMALAILETWLSKWRALGLPGSVK